MLGVDVSCFAKVIVKTSVKQLAFVSAMIVRVGASANPAAKAAVRLSNFHSNQDETVPHLSKAVLKDLKNRVADVTYPSEDWINARATRLVNYRECHRD
jgi:hypothetical protein